MAAITICSDFGAPKIKSDTVSPSISHEVMGLDAMIFAPYFDSAKTDQPEEQDSIPSHILQRGDSSIWDKFGNLWQSTPVFLPGKFHGLRSLSLEEKL